MSMEKKVRYEGCVMLSPDGIVMCRCSRKRANWYLSHNLAILRKADPYTIQLTFTPGGLGKSNDEFYLQSRDNLCVVCGTTENLTRHHCVPHCFRRYFALNIKENASHDVLPLCWNCHMEYENAANILKSSIVVKRCSETVQEHRMIYKAARTLTQYYDVVPEKRKEQLIKRISDVYGPINDILLQRILNDPPMADLVDWKATVENIKDIGAFIAMWRAHFIETMNPQFMPQFWSIEGRVGT